MKNTSDYFMLGLLLICMRLDKKVCYKVLDNNYNYNRCSSDDDISAVFCFAEESNDFSRIAQKH